MFIARKNPSTTDERSKGIDSQDPFLVSEIPVAGAIVNPIVSPVTSAVAGQTVATLNTTTIGYGSFTNRDASDHYKFAATPGSTYSLVVTTDFANPNITTNGFGDYFDIYFEDGTGTRLTQGFQIKDLDLKTKLVEFTVPSTAAANATYYVQVDNAIGQPFEYAIALYDKSATPKITVSSREVTTLAGSTLEVTFTSSVVLTSTRPRTDRIEVSNGTLSNYVRSTDGKSYTATFTPNAGVSEPGVVKALSGAFFSVSGDPNLDGDEANNTATVALDTTPPKLLSVTSSIAQLSGSSKPTLTFKFSEAVLDFTATDVAVTDGTLSEFKGSGDTYTAVLTPAAGAAQVQLTVAKGAFTDAARARNASVESFSTSFAVDSVAPTATLTIDKTTLSAGETATVTILFSEAVTGFDLSDLTSAGGTLSNLVAVGTDGRKFNVTLTPSSTDRRAEITVSLKANSLTDAAGNANAAATSKGVMLDSAPAVVRFVTSDGLVNQSEKATITIELSESSSDFTSSDLSVQGGTLGTLTRSADGKTYTTEFTPTLDREGAATVSIAAGSFSNSLNQTNKNAAALSFNVDTKLPSVAIASNKASIKPSETATLTLTFSEPVSDLTIEDLMTADGTLSGLTSVGADGKVYTVSLTTNASRVPEISVTLRQNAIVDAAGNQLAAVSTFKQAVDITPSVVSITVDDDRLGSGEATIVSIELSEAVTDFTLEDLEVIGGTLLDFTGQGSSYSVVFEPAAGYMDTGKIAVKAKSFTGQGGMNQSGASVTVQVDTVRPTLAITTSDNTLNKGETATITFTLSEASTDFAADDITVTGGQLSNFSGSGKVYTATFTPTDNAATTGSVKVAPSRFQDSFGNLNARGATLSFTVDTTKTITPPDGGGTGGGTTPPTATKLEIVDLATVSGNSIVFAVKDAAANATKLEFAGAIQDVAVMKDGTTTTFTPQAGSTVDAGILAVTNGVDRFEMGLDLALGTDGDDELSYVDPDPAIDPETGESVLVASALFGFGGNDILTEGASTVAMVGGDGVDEYRLTVGVDAPTLIVEQGSPIKADLINVPGAVKSFYDFDLVRGFDVGSDTLHLAKAGNATKVVGTYIDALGTFLTGGAGSDLLVFDDANNNGTPDAGENAVLLVGVGASASAVNVIGG